MNIIALSLYGNDPLYSIGAVENAKLIPRVYPGWTLKVFCGAEVNENIKQQLKNLGAETEVMSHEFNGPIYPLPGTGRVKSRFGQFWRFLAIADPRAEHVIFRDCDSRINPRENIAVKAWMEHPNHPICQTMKDHVDQDKYPILAGMWGIKAKSVDIIKLLEEWGKTHGFGGDWYDDQEFLQDKVWPLVQHSHIRYGRFGVPFPPHAQWSGFVGQRVDTNNRPIP